MVSCAFFSALVLVASLGADAADAMSGSPTQLMRKQTRRQAAGILVQEGVGGPQDPGSRYKHSASSSVASQTRFDFGNQFNRTAPSASFGEDGLVARNNSYSLMRRGQAKTVTASPPSELRWIMTLSAQMCHSNYLNKDCSSNADKKTCCAAACDDQDGCNMFSLDFTGCRYAKSSAGCTPGTHGGCTAPNGCGLYKLYKETPLEMCHQAYTQPPGCSITTTGAIALCADVCAAACDASSACTMFSADFTGCRYATTSSGCNPGTHGGCTAAKGCALFQKCTTMPCV